MKRERLFVYIAAGAVALLFAGSGYVYYLQRQTAGLMAARETSPAAGRFARIQEVLHSSKGLGGATAPVPAGPDPETAELLEAVREAEALLARFHEEIRSETEWEDMRSDILARPVSTWSEADWNRLNAFFAAHGAFLAEVRALSNASGPLYPLELAKGLGTLLPHLAPLRNLARLLQASAITLAHNGQYHAAAAEIMAGLRLSARLGEEPLVIPQFMRAAMNGIMYDAAVRAFGPGQIPSELTAELARHFHDSDLAGAMAQGWRTQEDMGLGHLSNIINGGWANGSQEWDDLFTAPGDARDSWAGFLYASPLARPLQHLDAQAYARIMDEFEQTLRMPYYEARYILEQLEREVEALPMTRVFTRNMLPPMEDAHRAIAEEQARQQLLLLGAAVEAYANEHGEYPPRLEDAQGLAHGASAIDPFTGMPFHYSAGDNSFQLYSVGQNLTDDGGRHDTREGDIVWRGSAQPKAAAANLVAKAGSLP